MKGSVCMKRLFTKVKQKILWKRNKQKHDNLFSDVNRLLQSQLSTQEIQLFLNVDFSKFDHKFLNTYYSDYIYLADTLNILALISYIDFISQIKKDIRNQVFKQTIYPIILLMTAVGTLYVFKNYLMTLLSDYVEPFLSVLVSTMYFLTQISILFLFLLLIVSVILVNRKDYYLMAYSKLFNLRFFKLHETYHLKLMIQFLIIAYEDGLSTGKTFELMNRFKGETIISNIAYFVSEDLTEGYGINKSIENMRLSETFKKVLKFAIESDRYYEFIKSYNIQLDEQFKHEIKIVSRYLYTVAYIYIIILVLLFYKIMGLPLALIDQF